MINFSLAKEHIWVYFFSIIGGIILAHFSYWIIGYAFSEHTFSKDSLSFYSDFPRELLLIFILLVAPFLETFIFQYIILKLPIIYGLKPSKINLLILLIISSILFSLNHIYSLPYFIYSGVLGLFLSSLYIYVEYFRKTKTNGFILVLVVHFFINLYAIF